MYRWGRAVPDKNKATSESVGRLLDTAMPLPEGDGHFVTRGEFVREIVHLETVFDTKLELAKTNLQKWILGGIITFAMIFGGFGFGAYNSVMHQFSLMRTAGVEASRANERLDKRLQWTIEQERHDAAQDVIIRKVDPDYMPPDGPSIPQ